MPSTPSLPACRPRLATPRNPARASLGAQVEGVAELLGLPPMPWQTDLYAVTHEVDPAGHLWFRIVVVVVPRQQGKSSATNAVMVRRSVMAPNMTTVYTAQDRSIAAERLVEQLYERQLRPSPLGPAVEARRANGSERLTFRNGSRVILVAPHERSAHGMTLDLAMIDEAWAQRDMSLPQAFSPAMVTRPDAQLWIVSTVGDGSDSLLAHYQAAGAASLADPDSRLCYVEYSAAPTADPDDPATWLACMPAIGHTIDLDTIRAERAGLPSDEFERAYLCRRPVAGPADRLISAAAWAAGLDPAAEPTAPLAMAVEVPFDRSSATIAVCGSGGPDVRVVEVIDRRPDTGWVTARLVELWERHRPTAIVIDPGGPAAPWITDLEALRLPVKPLTARDLAAACGGFYDDVRRGAVRHRTDRDLDAAVAAVQRRPLSNAWAWDRRAGLTDVSPLVAVTLARWGHVGAPGPPIFAAR